MNSTRHPLPLIAVLSLAALLFIMFGKTAPQHHHDVVVEGRTVDAKCSRVNGTETCTFINPSAD